MTRFCPFPAARCRTSSVAIIVTAIPVTPVCGSPALNVSTVGSCHGTPTCVLICSITWFAVRIFSAFAGACEVCPSALEARRKITARVTAVFMERLRCGDRLSPVPTLSGKQAVFVSPALIRISQALGHNNEMARDFQRNGIGNRCYCGRCISKPFIKRWELGTYTDDAKIHRFTASCTKIIFRGRCQTPSKSGFLPAGPHPKQTEIAALSLHFHINTTDELLRLVQQQKIARFEKRPDFF